MAKKFMTNGDTIKLFEQIDDIKESLINQDQKDKSIKEIQDKILKGLSFLVYGNAKGYMKFPNYEDLVQEGFIGLLKAIRRFDRKLFPNFFIYSERWIRHSIRRAASRFDVVYSPTRKRVVYSEPSETEVDVTNGPEDEFIAKETAQKLRLALNEFPEREREIVERIFGMDTQNPETLRGIGPSFGLTHERIRQIKNQVVDKLRENKNLNELC